MQLRLRVWLVKWRTIVSPHPFMRCGVWANLDGWVGSRVVRLPGPHNLVSQEVIYILLQGANENLSIILYNYGILIIVRILSNIC